jgi:hypothetical protein
MGDGILAEVGNDETIVKIADLEHLEQEVERLRAERDEAREALERTVDWLERGDMDDHLDRFRADMVRARRVLQSEGTDTNADEV